MKIRLISALVIGLALASAACAQDAGSAPSDNQAGPGGYHQHGGRGGMMGHGVSGTVTEAAADHYTVKTFEGETYTIHVSANTRFVKQQAGQGGPGGWRRGGESNPPEQIKQTDIKVGDAIATMGEADAAAKSVGAATVVLLDPERVKQMQQEQANYGKTWLMGKVTAIDGTKVTIEGGPGNATHSFVADENTTFRKRREPVTLADIAVGDMVRVEGAVKGDAFAATTVNDMGAAGEARVPRNGPPQ